MKSQVCEPCAKRKVRCDKGEPCSNCKRRKKDHCTYSKVSPFEKIKRLENLVRSLGGHPESDARNARKPTETSQSPAKPRAQLQSDDHETASANGGKSRDPVILEEDGQALYLES